MTSRRGLPPRKRSRAALLLGALALLLAAHPAWSQDDAEDVPCPDLGRMSQRLRNGADNCDAAVAQGVMSSCQVKVPFSVAGIPGLSQPAPAEAPWLTTPASARKFAADLDAVRCVESFSLDTVPAQPQPG